MEHHESSDELLPKLQAVMTSLEYQFLCARQEAVLRQQELVPNKMISLAQHIAELRLVEAADAELCTLAGKHTHIEPDDKCVITMPAPFNDWTRHEFWDVAVCQRWVLSDLGKQVLDEGAQALDENQTTI